MIFAIFLGVMIPLMMIEIDFCWICNDVLAITPWTLKKYTKLNWFGCWLCAVIVRILNPIWSIIYFVYWTTHI